MGVNFDVLMYDTTDERRESRVASYRDDNPLCHVKELLRIVWKNLRSEKDNAARRAVSRCWRSFLFFWGSLSPLARYRMGATTPPPPSPPRFDIGDAPPPPPPLIPPL